MDGALRSAAGEVGLRRLPLPVTSQMAGDKAQVAAAVRRGIDTRVRDGLAFAREPYLHSLRMPLTEAEALDEAQLATGGQSDGFGNECEGHCGVWQEDENER